MQTNVVGKPAGRVDGLRKVTGSAIYGDDIQLPGMLHAVCRHADIPAGEIVALDLSAAEAVPGVVKIATYRDIPGHQKVGILIRDYLPIVDNEVFFRGDVIAVVAAETYEAACQAAEKIQVRYAPKPAITDPREAMKPGARLVRGEGENNRVIHHHTEKGDIDAGFAEAAHIVERHYEVGNQEHAYIEPESVTAYPDPSENALVISGSIQNAHRVRGFVAEFLGEPQARVNVKRSVLGGSFGGKDDVIDHIACRVGLMAKLTGRPVKMTYTREQSLRESCKRHPYFMDYKIGLDENGHIIAMKIDITADSGAYAASSPFVTWRSVVQAAGPYRVPNVRVDISTVYTNNCYTSAFRGFGAPQVIFANESLMDELAAMFNLDPLEMRRRNMLQQGDVSITGQVFDGHRVSAGEVLEKASTRAEFLAKREQYAKLNAQGGHLRYGIGLALSYRGCSMGAEGVDASSALIQVSGDGSINLSTSVSENGQGLQTSMSLICAEAFGVPLAQVCFTEPPTSMIADGGSTVASRGTIMGGRAVLDAADKIRRRILSQVADEIGTDQLEESVWAHGQISNKADPSRSISFAAAVDKTKWAGVNLSDYGWFLSPKIDWDEEKGCGNPYFTWVYSCQVADLVVDTHTGKITLNEVTAAHDVGKVINKKGFEGQVPGGIAQGFGYAVLEDFNSDGGVLKSENFDTYLLPTIKDIPPVNVIAVENEDPSGPYGAKSIGEPALELIAAATSNAVSFALGQPQYKLPLTLEQVKLGYNLRKPERQSEVVSVVGEHKQIHRLNSLSVEVPTSLEQALALLAQPGTRPLAGGTDILVQARLSSEPQQLVDISGLAELKQIRMEADQVRIGAGVCFTDLVDHSGLAELYPLLVEACQTVGSLQLRNRATVGGNIVNAAPCADSVPPLVLSDARVRLQSVAGERELALGEFIRSGYSTALQAGELLTEIILPLPESRPLLRRYSQLGRRNALNITRQSLCAEIGFDSEGLIDHCRLVDGALLSKPQRLEAVEQRLLGRALDDASIQAAAEVLEQQIVEAIGGRWSAPYKTPVFLNMFRQLLRDLVAERAA